jgi:hypothetical protein
MFYFYSFIENIAVIFKLNIDEHHILGWKHFSFYTFIVKIMGLAELRVRVP